MVVDDIKGWDLLRLKSGGPTMTVASVFEDEASVIWFPSNGTPMPSQLDVKIAPIEKAKFLGS
jgi:uncharacterized protein YodC (DUF2158 family)